MCSSFLVALLGSLAVSTLVVGVFRRPLASALGELCEGREGIRFWVIFTSLMLFLVPLLVVVIYAVPDSCDVATSTTSFYTKLVASILGGILVGLLIAGWQVARFSARKVSREAPTRQANPARNDNEFWGNQETNKD